MSEVVFAAERLLPAAGGAERFMLEALAHLAERGHRVRALWIAGEPGPGTIDALPAGVEGVALAPPPETPYWEQRRVRREMIGAAVAKELAAAPADVIVSQLHAAPGVIEQAGSARQAIVLPSHEAFCKLAFVARTTCEPERGCAACPGSIDLAPPEREELVAARAAQERALRESDALASPSAYISGICERWTGRSATVVFPIVRATSLHRRPDPSGHVLLAAARWSADKGAGLIAPIARALPDRRFVVTREGLGEREGELSELGNVRLVEPAPIAELLGGAALVLVPSQLPEAFGRVAFEAISAGVPVLASGVGGLPEVVPREQLIVEPNGVDAWIDAISRLDSAPEWRAARLRARERADELLVSRPVDTFERLLLR